MFKFFWIISTTLFIYKPKIFGLGYEGEIVGLLIFLFSILKNSKRTLKNLSNSFVVYTILFFLITIILSFFWIFIHDGTYNYLQPQIKILSNIFGVIGVVSFLKISSSKFINYLKYIYLFQITYMYVGIFFPEITRPIQSFIFNDQYELIISTYFGQRGFSFTGSLAYSSSILLSTFLIFIITNNKIFKKNSTYENLFFYAISIIPLLTAARISIVTLILVLILIFAQARSKKTFILFLVLILISLSIFFKNSLTSFDIRVFEFIFEPIINFLNQETLLTSSSQKLLNDMYFKINSQDLFYGTGMYYNPDGSYFGYTDAGYMRLILFFGIPFTIFFTISNILFIRFLINKSNYHPILFPIITLFILLYQIKGDILGYNVDFYTLLLLFLFYKILNKIKSKLI